MGVVFQHRLANDLLMVVFQHQLANDLLMVVVFQHQLANDLLMVVVFQHQLANDASLLDSIVQEIRDFFLFFCFCDSCCYTVQVILIKRLVIF